ncbi:MAG: selenocysteine-specific translation elongation factor, partial [Alphaproteobacteria bacterium]|nr:selenocysteine-specific translation elongation factor [Alphaproteobacteria bacterium]
MIIGTAGHVDHGKTALVKALTGVDADRLPEEKRRGITLDLGYAYDGDLGFIDVPGHERLVHTMLAGAGAIDAALLVVAADDGVMPQTREHAQILDLLGITRGVVAVSKIDVAPGRYDVVAGEIRALLGGTGLADAPLHAVSVLTGEGVAELLSALRRLAPMRRDTDAHPRLAVDRAFTLTGAGLVVTGTLVAGRIAVEDRLVLCPGGRDLRVRGLHAQNRRAETAQAGQRVALNIVGPKLSKHTIGRGDWVLHPELDAPTAALDAEIRLLPDGGALKPDAPVHVHLAAAHVTGRVAPLDPARLAPGGAGVVRLTLDRAIGALAGDRLVLRDAAASRTIGGGRVLDPFPPRRGRASPVRLSQLAALTDADPAGALGRLLGEPPGWTAFAPFARARNLAPARQAAVLAAAPAVLVGDLAMTPSMVAGLQAELGRLLAAHHAEAPDQPGLQPERLRALLPGRLPPAGFRALVESVLERGTVEQDGPWL